MSRTRSPNRHSRRFHDNLDIYGSSYPPANQSFTHFPQNRLPQRTTKTTTKVCDLNGKEQSLEYHYLTFQSNYSNT